MINRQGGLSDYLNIANGIFERTEYQASDSDIENLAKNMLLLERRGLSKLNSRLIDGGRKIWDTFSEHNFASILVSHISQEIPISYEPENGLQRPPDFKVAIGTLTYWVQVKNLSELESRDRQEKIARKIEIAVQEKKKGKYQWYQDVFDNQL